MPNEAISKLVLTETERNLAEQLVDSYARGGTVSELCRKALALSKAVEEGKMGYRAPNGVIFSSIAAAEWYVQYGEKITPIIAIDVPIEGDARD